MNFNFFKNFNFSSLLSGAGNVLNIVKKTIPVYKELKPFISKEKKLIETNSEIKKESLEPNEYNDSLTFFQ